MGQFSPPLLLPIGAPPPGGAGVRGIPWFLPGSGASTGSFPAQIDGIRIWHAGAVVDLCVVAVGDAPAGMGGQPRVRLDGVTRAFYLVETSDPNASPVRFHGSAGTKSFRKKT